MKTVTYDDALWSLVPVEPTEKMIVEGFESEPNDYFTDQNELERYKALSGCRQAAYRASKCWSAMLRAAPTPPEVEQAQPDELKSVLAAARQAGWSFEKRADNSTHMVPLVVGTAQARPVVNQQMTTDSDEDDETLADTQRAIIEAAERRGYERAKAECGQVREDAANMFWDADEPETCEDSIHNIIVAAMDYRDIKVGDTVDIQRAIRLPDIQVRITAIEDEDGEGDLEYEVIDAARAAKGADND